MTIRIGRDHLYLDGVPYFARVQLTTSGGKLDLDQQDEEDGKEAPTSKVTFVESGWTPRRATLVLRLTRAVRGEQAGHPRAAVRRLQAAGRGRRAERHTMIGEDFEDLSWESPTIIEQMTLSRSTADHDSRTITLHILELDPELVSLRTAPAPTTEPEPTPDPEPTDQLTSENEELIESLEMTDFGPQPDPGDVADG